MVTTQTADSVLRSYYLSAVSDQLDKTTNPLLAAIRKTTSDVWGRDVRKTVRIGLGGGVGAGTEEGALPKAETGSYALFVSTLKNLYGAIEISDKAIRAAAGSEGTFVNLLNDEMNNLVRSSAFNLDRMLFGDGSGKLATCLTAKSSTPAVFDTVQNLTEGMTVDIYSEDGTLKTAGVKVTAVDRTAKTAALEGGDAAADDFLVMQGSYGLELTGLKAIFDDGEDATLYGLDKKSNAWLKPFSVKSTAFGEEELQTAIDGVEANAGGKIDFIVCSWDVRRALIKALSSYRRMEPMQLAGGHTALSFNGIPVVADRFCPEHTAYLLNTDDFAIHQLCDWQWLEGEDGKILKQIPGKAVYTATLVKYAELMCYRPAGQGVITGIGA